MSLYYNSIMAQQKKKNQAGIAVAIWILIAIVLLIVFLIKQDDIMTTLKSTGFFTHTIGTEPDFVANYETKQVPETEEPVQIIIQEEQTETQQIVSQPEQSIHQESVSTAVDVVTPQASTIVEDVAVPPTTTAKLFFVTIGGDGSVSRSQVNRSVQKTNSPLTASLNALLEGPNLAELDDGCMTLIPEGSRLLSASVKNKVATLNFSEEFEFNPYGVEGYIGQLMQVVYTATAFSTVESVQFLVEGQRKEYIGSEGVWIGSPLSTTSFK